MNNKIYNPIARTAAKIEKEVTAYVKAVAEQNEQDEWLAEIENYDFKNDTMSFIVWFRKNTSHGLWHDYTFLRCHAHYVSDDNIIIKVTETGDYVHKPTEFTPSIVNF